MKQPIDYKKLADLLLPIQRETKQYVTVRQAATKWKMNSTSKAFHILRQMVDDGLAEQFGQGHYHIKE